MSMNLNAATKNCVINLWQTPTQISYTILPSTTKEATGKNARDALLRYMEWVKYSINGSWDSSEQLQEAKSAMECHIEYVGSFINDKTLRVWVM